MKKKIQRPSCISYQCFVSGYPQASIQDNKLKKTLVSISLTQDAFRDMIMDLFPVVGSKEVTFWKRQTSGKLEQMPRPGTPTSIRESGYKGVVCIKIEVCRLIMSLTESNKCGITGLDFNVGQV